MTYTTAQKSLAAHLLCDQFPRLHFGVARAWVTAESGLNNNVFGVTVGGVLQKYPTMEAGVRAAATRIKTLLIYKAVRDAFNSPHEPGCESYGPHASGQASALCRSPWHSGVSGVKAQGGIDLYYRRIFKTFGYRIA